MDIDRLPSKKTVLVYPTPISIALHTLPGFSSPCTAQSWSDPGPNSVTTLVTLFCSVLSFQEYQAHCRGVDGWIQAILLRGPALGHREGLRQVGPTISPGSSLPRVSTTLANTRWCVRQGSAPSLLSNCASCRPRLFRPAWWGVQCGDKTLGLEGCAASWGEIAEGVNLWKRVHKLPAGKGTSVGVLSAGCLQETLGALCAPCWSTSDCALLACFPLLGWSDCSLGKHFQNADWLWNQFSVSWPAFYKNAGEN